MLYQLGSLLFLGLLVAAIALAGLVVDAGLAFLVPARASVPGNRHPADRWLLRFGLGSAAWILSLFALAAMGWFGALQIWGLVIASVALGLAALLLRPKLNRDQTPATKRQREDPLGRKPQRFQPIATAILVSALATTAVVLVVQSLRPDVSWDASVYHLTLPKLYLAQGGFLRVPFNVYSNWPLGIELLFGAAMALRDYVLAKLFHFSLGALTAVAVYRIAGPRFGLLGAAFFLFNPVVLFEIRIAYIDLAYALFFLLASQKLSQALDSPVGSPNRLHHLAHCSLLAAILCAVKLNGFFGPMVLFLIWAGSSLRSSRRINVRQWLGEVAWWVVPSLLLGAPWLIKNWLLTGNPVYPLLYEWFGGPEWSSRLSEQHAAWQRAIGMGRQWIDYLLLPFRVIWFGELGYGTFDGKIHRAWLVLLPLALYGARGSTARSRMAGRFLVASALFFLLWAFTSQQMRLLLPILPLLSVAATLGISALFDRLQNAANPRAATSLEIVLALAVALALVQSAWLYVEQTPRLTRDLVTQGAELKQAVVRPVYRFIEADLPADARLLLINNNHGFFLERDYIADSFFEASQISDLFAVATTTTEVRQTFEQLGLTHALVENRRGPAYPDSLVEVLQDPTQATPIFRSPDGRFVVLEFQ